MAAGDLITLAQLQTAMPKLGAAQLAYAPLLISAASGLIARNYPKARPATAHDEEHEIGTDRTVTLGNRPVLSVARVSCDNAQVVTITRTATSSVRATATLATTEDGATATGVELQAWSGGVQESDVTLPFDTYPGVQALADAINALAGWRAVVAPGREGMATADFRPTQGGYGALGTGAALRAYARDMNDWDLDRATGRLFLYEFRAEGYRFPDRTWAGDPRDCKVRVLSSAGRATPAEVQAACTMIVKDCFEATARGGLLISESTEDYSYRLATGDYTMPPLAKSMLRNYRERTFS